MTGMETLFAVIIGILAVAQAGVVLATSIMSFRTRKDVKQVHVLVNSKMTAALQRIEQLGDALNEADIKVPMETQNTQVETYTEEELTHG